MKIAFYSHDAMGLGHFRRNLLLAKALIESPEVEQALLTAGTPEVTAFRLPPGVDCMTLPPLRKGKDGSYTPRNTRARLEEFIRLRSEILFSAFKTFRPDVVVVDKHPRGIFHELDRSLAWLAQNNSRLVLGLRDVLDDPEVVRHEWQQDDSIRAIRQHYDAIWIYGDPSLYDQRREYDLPDDIAEKVQYVGYLDRGHGSVPPSSRSPEGSAEIAPRALCLLGGGQDGYPLARHFARALPPGMPGVIVTGPFMPRHEREELEGLSRDSKNLSVVRFLLNQEELLRRADRVVAMGGYNTVSEVLAMGKPLLVVPRVRPRREQLIRAGRLAQHGLLSVLHPDSLTTGSLSQWIESPVPPRRLMHDVIDCSGLRRLPGFLESLRVREPASSYQVRRAG